MTATLDGAADAVDVELVEPPANLAPPEITGSAVAGGELACSLGEWSGAGLLLAQRWTRDGADLPGATGPVYRTGVADAGHAVGCVVTATNAVGVAVEAAAAPVAVVPPPVRPQPHASSTGAVGAPQQVQVAIEADDQITLLDAAGDPATEVEVADAGRYRLETAGTTATITFTPLAGFSGAAPPIAFQVTDVHGRSVLGSFAPTVLPDPVAEPEPSAEPDPDPPGPTPTRPPARSARRPPRPPRPPRAPRRPGRRAGARRRAAARARPAPRRARDRGDHRPRALRAGARLRADPVRRDARRARRRPPGRAGPRDRVRGRPARRAAGRRAPDRRRTGPRAADRRHARPRDRPRPHARRAGHRPRPRCACCPPA